MIRPFQENGERRNRFVRRARAPARQTVSRAKKAAAVAQPGRSRASCIRLIYAHGHRRPIAATESESDDRGAPFDELTVTSRFDVSLKHTNGAHVAGAATLP
jgi:hypothetical protein